MDFLWKFYKYSYLSIENHIKPIQIQINFKNYQPLNLIQKSPLTKMNESQMSKGSEFITQYDLTKLEEMDPSLGKNLIRNHQISH